VKEVQSRCPGGVGVVLRGIERELVSFITSGRHAYLRYTTERRLSPAWTALPRDAPAVSRGEPANGTLRTEGPFPLASQSWHAPGGWRWALQHTPPRDAPEQSHG
jgi:hypothetical protein